MLLGLLLYEQEHQTLLGPRFAMCCNLEKWCLYNHRGDYSLHLRSVKSMASFGLLFINCSLCPIQINTAKVHLNTQVLTAQPSPCKEHSALYKHSKFPSAFAEATQIRARCRTCPTQTVHYSHCTVLCLQQQDETAIYMRNQTSTLCSELIKSL